MRDERIETPHGEALAITRWPGEDVVVVAGAVGVKRRFYDAFATHLASRGLGVVTFDYQGIGDSAPAGARGSRATLDSWSEDLGAVLAAARAEAGRLVVVGHSVGGQLLGLHPDAGVERALLVAAQSGWWKHWAGRERRTVWALWHLLIPTTTLMGWFPASRFGLGEDLPAGVARQWARWGRHPDYLWQSPEAAAAYARFHAPVRVLGFTDDVLQAPVPAVRDLARRYNGPVDLRLVEPEALGQRKLGHFGWFRGGLQASWDEQIGWLRA